MTARQVTITYGPPGTGKTRHCVDRLIQAIKGGLEPHEVALVSFTRAAAREARERVVAAISGLDARDLPFVTTLHALAYRRLRITSEQLLFGARLRDAVYEATGWQLAGEYSLNEATPAYLHAAAKNDVGDRCLRFIGMGKAWGCGTREAWRRENGLNPRCLVPWETVEDFERRLKQHKQESDLVEFPDIMDLDHGQPLPVRLFVVDEGQDLSPQQWAYARRLAAVADEVLLAGDDDQSIFEWAGADPLGLRRFHGGMNVLRQSHRVPRLAHQRADKIVRQICDRQDKVWTPRDDDGEVTSVSHLGQVPSLRTTGALVLARHVSQLRNMANELRDLAVPFEHHGRSSLDRPYIQAIRVHERLRAGEAITRRDLQLMQGFISVARETPAGMHHTWESLGWPEPRPSYAATLDLIPAEDLIYPFSVMQRGYRLDDKPLVRLSTIHGAKGHEHDTVVLCINAKRHTQLVTDAERRVAYVGLTRARKALHLYSTSHEHRWSV